MKSLGKNSTKCPEVRNNFAWFACHDQNSAEGVDTISLYLHGGSVTPPGKGKKTKYLSDFYHLDV